MNNEMFKGGKTVEIIELINKGMVLLTIIGVIASLRYLDGRALARKKFRKPKYKQYKID